MEIKLLSFSNGEPICPTTCVNYSILSLCFEMLPLSYILICGLWPVPLVPYQFQRAHVIQLWKIYHLFDNWEGHIARSILFFSFSCLSFCIYFLDNLYNHLMFHDKSLSPHAMQSGWEWGHPTGLGSPRGETLSCSHSVEQRIT